MGVACHVGRGHVLYWGHFWKMFSAIRNGQKVTEMKIIELARPGVQGPVIFAHGPRLKNSPGPRYAMNAPWKPRSGLAWFVLVWLWLGSQLFIDFYLEIVKERGWRIQLGLKQLMIFCRSYLLLIFLQIFPKQRLR